MCGIAGAFGGVSKFDGNEIAGRIIHNIRYRGPDGHGVETFLDGLFVHLRLSIIDTSEGGAQPKWSGDGRYCITYNGEIYNYRELRSELIGLGHRFETESDTEVLLRVWQVWGSDGLRRCIGMYAFALYDKQQGELHFARDPYGIKPIYIAEFGGGVRFASTYTALACFPECPRRANPVRTFEYVRHGLLEADGENLIQGVTALPPGHVETWDVAGDKPRILSRKEIWIPRYSVASNPPSFAVAAEELREAFLHSIRLHMRSDVPIGFALSGGLDSSAIVCAARMHEPQADLRTFTYAGDGNAVDESPWAEFVSSHTRSKSTVIRLPKVKIVESIRDIVKSYGTFERGASGLAQIAVFAAAHEAGIKVMLDGQGADETFAGYPYYLGAAVAGDIRSGAFVNAAATFSAALRMPRMRPWMAAGWTADYLVRDSSKRFLRRLVGLEQFPDWIDRSWLRAHLPERTAIGPTFDHFGRDVLAERLQNDLTRYQIPDLVMFEDRTSMCNSVESRVPFLSQPITDLAFSVPSSYHIGPQRQTKALFREAMRGILPEEIRTRRDKVGFEVPQGQWLHAEHAAIDTLLRGEAARRISLFNHAQLIRRWEAIDGPLHRDFHYVWRWISLVLWTQVFEIDWA